MITSKGISFLGQSMNQISRLKQLNTSMADLQRQLTTQKKYTTFSGFGADSMNVQRYRMDTTKLSGYLQNIDTATTRIQLMSDSMTRAASVGRELLESISLQVRNGEIDMDTIAILAQQGLDLMRDISNIDIDGRYLFSGSSTSAEPIPNQPVLQNNMQAQVNDWRNGTITTAQLIAAAEGFTTAELGFDPALSASGGVAIRVDDTTEIDYTSIASSNGFEDIVRALGMAANLQLPAGADVPTLAEFHDVLDSVMAIATRGIEATDSANAQLTVKYELIKSIQDGHRSDVALFEKLTGEKENVDTTEVVAKIQSLQTQLTSSYEVTSLVSQMSLVNFL